MDSRDVLIYGLEGLYIMIYHLMSCLSILTITYTIKQKFSSPLTNDRLTGQINGSPSLGIAPKTNNCIHVYLQYGLSCCNAECHHKTDNRFPEEDLIEIHNEAQPPHDAIPPYHSYVTR